MRRGTTPTIKILVSNIDLSQLSSIIITFKQDCKTINKQAVVDGQYVITELSQEETLSLKTGNVSVQIKAKTPDNKVIASGIRKTTVDDILNEELI